MVFRRREKRTLWIATREAIWPRGGWARALQYLKHRVNRLPDPPHRIARGIFAGILVSFTPLFGLHLGAAVGLAWLMGGNIVAALIGTLVGNPLTFPFIALIALELGHLMLGHEAGHHVSGVGEAFLAAGADLKHNFIAIFTAERTEWAGLGQFFDDVFWPYLVGGLVPGILVGLVGYHVTLPIVTAYQNRRRHRLKARLDKIRARLAAKREGRAEPDPGEAD
ncbi:MAG: DUF2062 domain-containing protein [Sphingomonadales bacterium]|nr:DUF2062 domain-containing protein [Sphingomonadales bacterium]